MQQQRFVSVNHDKYVNNNKNPVFLVNLNNNQSDKKYFFLFAFKNKHT